MHEAIIVLGTVDIARGVRKVIVNRMNYPRLMLLLCSVFWISAGLEAGELDQQGGASRIAEQVRGSVNRMKSFTDDSALKQYAPNPQREKELRRLLPNFQITKKGTSSREERELATARLRKVRLTNSGRQTSSRVLENLSLFRRLPEIRFEVNPETYDYFLGHPDVVVSLWRAMGISSMQLQQTGPFQYKMDNSDGTKSEMFYLRRSKTTNIIYCRGEFKSPLLKKPIAGSGILCLHSKFEKQNDGTVFVRHSADVFITFPNAAIETAAKMISPVSNYISDRNFQEISLFMHTISLSMARQPSWLQQMADRLQNVHPDRRQELRQVILNNYHQNQKRLASRWNELEQPAM